MPSPVAHGLRGRRRREHDGVFGPELRVARDAPGVRRSPLGPRHLGASEQRVDVASARPRSLGHAADAHGRFESPPRPPARDRRPAPSRDAHAQRESPREAPGDRLAIDEADVVHGGREPARRAPGLRAVVESALGGREPPLDAPVRASGDVGDAERRRERDTGGRRRVAPGTRPSQDLKREAERPRGAPGVRRRPRDPRDVEPRDESTRVAPGVHRRVGVAPGVAPPGERPRGPAAVARRLRVPRGLATPQESSRDAPAARRPLAPRVAPRRHELALVAPGRAPARRVDAHLEHQRSHTAPGGPGRRVSPPILDGRRESHRIPARRPRTPRESCHALVARGVAQGSFTVPSHRGRSQTSQINARASDEHPPRDSRRSERHVSPLCCPG